MGRRGGKAAAAGGGGGGGQGSCGRSFSHTSLRARSPTCCHHHRHHRHQTGTSNAAFWESEDSADFERTPLGVNEYRQEVFAPPFLFRAGRPARAAPHPPAWVPYGGSFDMGFTLPAGAGPITGVVWADPGGTTHNYAIVRRPPLPLVTTPPPVVVGQTANMARGKV